jgi:Ca-activated chloride channel family protein
MDANKSLLKISNMRQSRIILAAILFFVAFWLGANVLKGKDATDKNHKIKMDVDLVAADVSVIGTPEPELKAEDFAIYDNGVAQEIRYFSHDQRPMAVALLVDVSNSTREYLTSLRMAAVSALRQLKPEDQVALYLFAAKTWKKKILTKDKAMIAQEIGAFDESKINCGCATNIYDTIYNASKYLEKAAPDRRRAIILISDNCQSGVFKRSQEDCLTELLESATTLSGIRTQGDRDSGCTASQKGIKNLAEETGSDVVEILKPTSLKAVLEKAVSNIRMQYTVGFNPINPDAKGTFHKLRVELKLPKRCPECRLIARRGYYSGISAPLPPKEKALNGNPAKDIDRMLVQRSIFIAGTGYQELEGINFYPSTVERKGADGQPQVVVNLQIFPDKVNFKTENDLHACNLHAMIIYADKNGHILGSDSRKIGGSLSQKTYEQTLRQGISFSRAIPLKVPDQLLKIVVYDEANDMAGSQLLRLNNASYR